MSGRRPCRWCGSNEGYLRTAAGIGGLGAVRTGRMPKPLEHPRCLELAEQAAATADALRRDLYATARTALGLGDFARFYELTDQAANVSDLPILRELLANERTP